MSCSEIKNIITVSLNPAVDRTIEVKDLTPGRHQIGKEISRTPGGKGVNVSRTLSAMGVGSIATGFLGSDNRYEFHDFLENPLVEDKFVVLPGRTRENITLADSVNNLDTHIRDRGLEINEKGLSEFDSVLQNFAGDSLIVFSGSLPPGISTDSFSRMLDTCINRGMKVVVDTSGDALAAAVGKKLFLAKPNAEELSEILGESLQTDSQLITKGRELCQNIQHLLISRGEQGALLITESQVFKAIPALCDKPILNTVGCGDVMLGSFIGAIAKGMGCDEALKIAIAQASACAFNKAAAKFDEKLAESFLSAIEVVTI